MSDLASLRERIDSLDSTIVDILNERAQVSLNIGAAKRKARGKYVFHSFESNGIAHSRLFRNTAEDTSELHVYMPGREKEVYKKVLY